VKTVQKLLEQVKKWRSHYQKQTSTFLRTKYRDTSIYWKSQ